jgi:hypothetical protein
MPKASLLCVVGAKLEVCLQGQNFYPLLWGLHNGACGTVVQEIIYATGTNPNKGDHPSYVVINFPQYAGPPWDKDNPKVSQVKPIHLFGLPKYSEPNNIY